MISVLEFVWMRMHFPSAFGPAGKVSGFRSAPHERIIPGSPSQQAVFI